MLLLLQACFLPRPGICVRLCFPHIVMCDPAVCPCCVPLLCAPVMCSHVCAVNMAVCMCCACRLPYDGERGVVLITALKAFNDHFFPCQVRGAVGNRAEDRRNKRALLKGHTEQGRPGEEGGGAVRWSRSI